LSQERFELQIPLLENPHSFSENLIERPSLIPIMDQEQKKPTNILKTVFGGIIFTASLVFLLYGIITVGVQWDIHSALIILLVLIGIYLLFLLEGTQISVVKLKEGGHIPPEVQTNHPDIARRLQDMGDDGVAMYLIGRQILVCSVVFIISQVTTLKEPLYSPALTYLAAIFVTVTIGQLLPQLVSEKFPAEFLYTVGTDTIIKISHFIAYSGLGHFSMFLGTFLISEKDDVKEDDSIEMAVPNDTKPLFPDNEGNDDLTDDVQRASLLLSDEILKELEIEIPSVKTPGHISPHVLLALILGQQQGQTKDKAEKLLSKLLSQPDNDLITRISQFLPKTPKNDPTRQLI